MGALAPQDTDIFDLFYSPVRFPETVVFDPFMGSGTTLGETLKLGGRAIGRDINPVSYLQVRTTLTLPSLADLERTYREIQLDVGDKILSYYTSRLNNGDPCQVLYYFWVMQVSCPLCYIPFDLFSKCIFAKHSYPRRHPTVQVVCPNCSFISPEDYRIRNMECSECGHRFDATTGPVKGKTAKCPHCHFSFAIGRAIRETGSPPEYRMYAKLVLSPDGSREYHPITEFDERLYRKAANELKDLTDGIPMERIKPGYNTDQTLNYGFRSWRHLFNARQLICISILAKRIKEIEDASLRDAFTCLFSGVLEFNNMFASYKGEGTGAVRHMFYHHILKPERTPLEANVWGTPKSSGAFSTLFQSRLIRAARYAKQPFELGLSAGASQSKSVKVDTINEPLVGITNSDSFEQFNRNARLYLSCGDSAKTDLPDKSVDLVVTDPPFFDNVHYSQLADFFYVWQKLVLTDSPNHKGSSTRAKSEVQNSDASIFTERLSLVLLESARVLKDNGLLVFTYHHSRWEGWQSVLTAVQMAGLRISACHPVKAELSVAVPKHQAKEPINFDIIMVCRKARSAPAMANFVQDLSLMPALDRAQSQISRLRKTGWKLSQNDIGAVLMAQIVAEITRMPGKQANGRILEEAKSLVASAIDRL